MTKYYYYIIYEDGSVYESTISSQKDVDKIPKSKAYEAIKIIYSDNTEYSHVIYGKDNVFLKYYKDEDDKCLYYTQFDDSEEFTKIVKLKGVGKEEIFTDSTDHLPITFKGKQLPDEEYERLRIQCDEYNRRRSV